MEATAIVPLVGASLNLARLLAGFVSGITDLRERYRNVDLNIRAVVQRSRTLRAAVERMRALLQELEGALSEDERESLYESVAACEMLAELLFARVKDANGCSKKRRRWEKVKVLWRQQQIDEYATTLSHQVTSLSLHLQVLSMGDAKAREQARWGDGDGKVERTFGMAIESAYATSSILSADVLLQDDEDDRDSLSDQVTLHEDQDLLYPGTEGVEPLGHHREPVRETAKLLQEMPPPQRTLRLSPLPLQRIARNARQRLQESRVRREDQQLQEYGQNLGSSNQDEEQDIARDINTSRLVQSIQRPRVSTPVGPGASSARGQNQDQDQNSEALPVFGIYDPFPFVTTSEKKHLALNGCESNLDTRSGQAASGGVERPVTQAEKYTDPGPSKGNSQAVLQDGVPGRLNIEGNPGDDPSSSSSSDDEGDSDNDVSIPTPRPRRDNDLRWIWRRRPVELSNRAKRRLNELENAQKRALEALETSFQITHTLLVRTLKGRRRREGQSEDSLSDDASPGSCSSQACNPRTRATSRVLLSSEDFFAATAGLTNEIRCLLRGGHDINARNECGETVLHIAAAELGYRTVRFLLSSGANVRARDNQGREPLNRVPFLFDKKPAVQEIVHLLLERGADANGGRHMESQPLHCAVVRGWTEIVQELVNHGAERNARRENDSCTPLELITKGLCQRPDPALVTILLGDMDTGLTIDVRTMKNMVEDMVETLAWSEGFVRNNRLARGIQGESDINKYRGNYNCLKALLAPNRWGGHDAERISLWRPEFRHRVDMQCAALDNMSDEQVYEAIKNFPLEE